LQGGWWRRRLRFSQAKDALDAAKTALLILGERATGPGDEPGPFKRLPARGALRKKPGQRRDGALFVEREQEGLTFHRALQFVERRPRLRVELVDHAAGEVVRPLVEQPLL